MNNTIQVTAAQLIIAIAGAAAIGALVSSFITLFGQWRERKSRRAELILAQAIILGHKNMDVALEVARVGGVRTPIMPLIEMVMDYHKFLTSLLNTGKMPADYLRVMQRPPEDR